ncbi:nuclease-related domain-containing protein [Neobacillus niacini]|uniref:nuclease-related domain-containing protein n=1 Tax=Neobacillus niacini TaxID=86668 RepID=UPI0021CB541E|nr:nuclease-related domain-containing protein [Neobacillus niacini]MCM3768069.1 NERD domain-containing protein [Neobacillus niacini]
MTEQEKRYFEGKKKGFEGEVFFDQVVTEPLECEGLVINDLLLKFNNTYFQIDTTIIFKDTIKLFDVKNFQGEYYYEEGRFYAINGSERDDPLVQLERCVSHFRQLLYSLGYKGTIEAYVVHVNPEFTLFQVPRTYPIIFPSQLNSLRKKLNNNQLKLNDWHRRLADKLISLHIVESPYDLSPAYDFDSLRKGNNCGRCQSFSITLNDRILTCNNCGHQETVESAILRGIGEIKLLFPEMKITVNVVYEWCGGVWSKWVIRNVLKKHFKATGYGKWCFYE